MGGGFWDCARRIWPNDGETSAAVRANPGRDVIDCEYARRSRVAEVGRETTAHERAGDDVAGLLCNVREQGRLAHGAVVQRGVECKSCLAQPAADSGARRRAYPA